ncbi:MAG TPA: HEAT repeat domain-containing protein [Candidatus Hydrogenedentes bacterium]|nr:HEAT repeat domain-containing protein [Candidatus Hydrogenedentota bacterium]HOL77863.1 HEAT repeat domain-containing protein [Candidatus Hydrogenedentota bacterium]HPO87028.1 HEAT repeat domain-containing protein [Candidatus Hydrogenedentota bacterium]
MRLSWVLCLGILSGFILGGCWKPSPERQQEAAVRARLDEWLALAQNPDESLQSSRPLQLVAEMISIRPDAFIPILDLFSNPDTPPKVRLMAHESLKAVVVTDKDGEVIVPALKPLVEPGHDPMVRACAIELLALTENTSLAELIRPYASDEEPRVRLAALCALARFGDQTAHDELVNLYRNTKPTETQRNRILLELARRPLSSDIPIFAEALFDNSLPPALRALAAVTLGHIGTKPELELLQRIAATPDTPEDIRGAAEGAIEAIKNRLNPPTQTP